jgi:predicted transposase YbfD/YdcC
LPSRAEWRRFQTAGKLKLERTHQGKTSTETQYYISSCEIDARLLGKVVRGHWGIESAPQAHKEEKLCA